MSRRLAIPLLITALLAGGGCYQDDSGSIGPGSVRPIAKVLLTDAPFPYDSVASVNVYVVSVAASTDPDTTGDAAWETIAEPGKLFDLLSLQQGTTALLGEGQLSGRLYRAIRVIIDADASSLLWKNGTEAHVNWPFPGSGRIALHTQVEEPLALITDASQVEIVIDWDVGRSFLYNYYDTTGTFTLIPWLRAVHKAFTGTLAGSVTSDYTGTTAPIANANIGVYSGDPNRSDSTWYLVATGRSNAAGFFRVAFLGSGTYIVRVEQPDYPFLAASITPAVEIAGGDTTNLPVSLTEAGAGGAFLQITGPTSVGVGGRITLFAAVRDAGGAPVPNPSVSWTSSDPAVAEVMGIGDTASVTGRQPGFATIIATSDTLSDSRTIQVTGTPASVASVTVQPASASLAVGDTMAFSSVLRDSVGNILTGRPVSWFSTDSAFVIEASYGTAVVGRGRRVGNALLQATSEGKTGQATITITVQ
jgi:uncharacterized protein DUF4382/Big-like domain-containing protein